MATTELAGRGDATRPDPAVIELAIEEAEAALDVFFSEPEKASTTRMIAEVAVEAAAPVIVAATAEQIAAAIEAGAVALHEDCGEIAAEIARSFAAGLSAGADSCGPHTESRTD